MVTALIVMLAKEVESGLEDRIAASIIRSENRTTSAGTVMTEFVRPAFGGRHANGTAPFDMAQARSPSIS